MQVIVVKPPNKFVQDAVVLGYGQGEQDVADLLGVCQKGRLSLVIMYSVWGWPVSGSLILRPDNRGKQ